MSDVDDDVLEQTGEGFGAPYGQSGFGTSEVLQELLSRDPKYVPIADLAAYQQSLIETGYLPPTYQPTGQWDPVSAAGARRADRDALNTTRSGGSWMAASTGTLFRYLGYTVPTSVFDGMLGIAQGIVSDAVTAVTHPKEVLEEGGFVGGAAVGAGIGAAAGLIGGPLAPVTSGVGALVGGAIGGVAGFFGDLFDDDEEEDGDWNRILGALTPIDEIRSGDAKNLFAALSTIMTASAVLKSAQVAKAGIAAAGGTRQLAMREGWKMAARADVAPGILNQMAQATLKHRTIGTAVAGGVLNAGHELVTTGDVGQAFRDFGSGALIGALASKGGRAMTGGKVVAKGSNKLIAALDAAPLARIQASGAGKVAQALYTGAAAPTIVARGVSEISGGKTAIGEDIQEADTASRLGPLGTVVDITVGTLVFPSRLLPWKGDDVATAFKSMSSNHALLPFANFNRVKAGGKTIGLGKSMDEVRHLLGDGDPVTLGARVNDSYLQYAIETRAARKVGDRLAELPPPKTVFERARRDTLEADLMIEERSALKAQILDEARAGGKEGDVVSTPLGNELLAEGMSNPVGMQNFLAEKGFDFQYWKQHQEATEYLHRRRSLIEEEGFNYTPAVKDEYLVAQDYERFGGVGDEIGEYEERATRFVAAREALDNADEANLSQFEDALVAAGNDLDDTLNEMRKRGVISDDIFNVLSPGVAAEPKVERRLIAYLKETAKTRPRRDDELTAELAERGLGRYMAVKTGENMLDYTHFLDQAEIQGIAEYGRRQNFFDSIASLGMRVDKADLGKLRYNSIVRHLDKTAGEVMDDMDGKTVANSIYDDLKARYDPEAAKRRGEKLEVKFGTIIRRETQGGEIKRELFKIDPRDLTTDDIVRALDLERNVKEGMDVYEAADRIKRSLHVGAAFGADVAHPLQTARSLGVGLRTNGMAGFSDFIRTANFVPTKLAAKMPGRFRKGSYGYIPQHLRRFHMALQFSLSPTFDASRFIEAWSFGKIRGGDIPIRAAGMAPKKWVHDFEEGWTSLKTGQRIHGKEAVDEMIEFGDRVLYGRAANANFDELQLRLLHRGVLGYKPREIEYSQAWWQAQKKLRKGPLTEGDLEEIRETIMQIGQYGTKQTALGNTAHFIFFPYLFSRKQISAIVDFTLGAPTRNLLVHEGVRRWYTATGEDGTSMSDDFRRITEKHFPILQELGRINNLAYGVSPGRFFLDGIVDKPTQGKIAQGIASVLAPGGVHSTIGDVAGQAVQLFMPQVWTEDSIRQAGGMTGVLGLVERLVPAYRDIDRWLYDQDRHGAGFGVIGAQVSALTGRGTPKIQMGEYLDMKRVMSTTLETVATGAGYSSLESLKNAQPEFAAAVDELEADLGQQFPEGARLAAEFTNKDSLKEQVLVDIARKEDRTEAEEVINVIAGVEARAKQIADASSVLTQEETLRAFAPLIRQFALGYVGDRQFMDIWDGLFATTYGPLRVAEVA